MKRSTDIRKRVGVLIALIQSVPAKHRTPAMQRLLEDLQRAASEYDGERGE
jgi:hypothetical protein